MSTLGFNLPEFLTETAPGEVDLTGHRIGLHHVVRCYRQRASVEMIGLTYPTLSLADIHKVIAFYLENREAVDRYCAQYDAEMDQLMQTARKERSA